MLNPHCLLCLASSVFLVNKRIYFFRNTNALNFDLRLLWKPFCSFSLKCRLKPRFLAFQRVDQFAQMKENILSLRDLSLACRGWAELEPKLCPRIEILVFVWRLPEITIRKKAGRTYSSCIFIQKVFSESEIEKMFFRLPGWYFW